MHEMRVSPVGKQVAIKNRPDEINKWSVSNGGKYHDTDVEEWTPLYVEKQGRLLEWVAGSYGSSKGKRGGVVLFTIGPSLTGPGYVLRSSLPGLESVAREDGTGVEHLRSIAEVAYRSWLAQTGALAV